MNIKNLIKRASTDTFLIKMKIMKIRIPPLVCGLTIGVWAALSQVIFAPILPLAYAIAMAGNPRDLLHWILNHALGTDLPVSSVSTDLPILTVTGILLGSTFAAVWTKEFRLRAAREPLNMFTIGFLGAISVSMLGACPIKATVEVAYGNLNLLIGLVSIIIGATLACEYVKWRVKK